MQKLLYLGIILMLASCGSNESESTASNESESTASNESKTALSTVNVDGKEVSTIRIGDYFEVMSEDLVGTGTWYEAMEACEDLGDGWRLWRLPTKDELNILYENKDEIGGFASSYYWSSTQGDSSRDASEQDFSNGVQYDNSKTYSYHVRLVRDI